MKLKLGFSWMLFVLLVGGSAAAQTRPVQRQQRPAPAPRGPLFLQRVKSFEETQYVSKVVLKNGMTVVVNEYRALPVVSVLTYIKVGYNTEPSDAPGISRVLQHMLFKGTPTRAVGVIRQDTQALGGILRGSIDYASTSLETVVPSMQWKKALEIQADLLLNPAFDPEELKREIEAVLLEMRGEQDVPDVFSGEKLLELGFPGHRLYRWGATTESLRSITREKLLDYYRSFYTSSRTILVVVGDVVASEVLNTVVQLYDKPKAAGEKTVPARQEIRQNAFRYAEVHGVIQERRVLFGFHTCPMTSEDYPATEVLRAILGVGEGSVLSFRLRDQKKIILDGSAELLGFVDLGYLTIRMTVESKNIDKSEIATLTDLELVKNKEPEAADMERAQAQLERMHWERLQTVTGRSRLLALYESLGDWKGMDRYLSRLRQVKPEDVSRVATKYLKLENCSLLEYLPTAEEPRNLTSETAFRTFQGLLGPSAEQEASEREHQTQLALDVPSGSGSFKFSEVRSQFQTASILRGPDLFIKEDHTAPVIQMGFFFPGGKLLETNENSGITDLMLHTMLRGTQDRGPDRYLRQMEIYGGHLEPVVADDYFGFLLAILSRNIDAGLELLGEAIKTPKFDKDELGRQKQIQTAVLRAKKESVTDYPKMLLEQTLFKSHPYSFSPEGNDKSLGSISAEAIQAWYQSEVKNKKPLVILLGDTQGTSLAGYFVKNFSGSRFQDVKLPESFAKPLEQKVLVEQNWDKNESLVLLGFQAPPEGDEDSFPVAVLQSHMSGSGGKLPVEICDKQGLAYKVSMEYRRGIRGGSVVVSAATSPANEEKVVKAVEEEFSRLFNNPMLYRDYRSAVNSALGVYWIGQQVRYSQITAMVENVLSGKGIDESQAYPTHIQDVKQDDLQETARRVFNLEKSATLRLHGRP
jgi:zinc protease